MRGGGLVLQCDWGRVLQCNIEYVQGCVAMCIGLRSLGMSRWFDQARILSRWSHLFEERWPVPGGVNVALPLSLLPASIAGEPWTSVVLSKCAGSDLYSLDVVPPVRGRIFIL